MSSITSSSHNRIKRKHSDATVVPALQRSVLKMSPFVKAQGVLDGCVRAEAVSLHKTMKEQGYVYDPVKSHTVKNPHKKYHHSHRTLYSIVGKDKDDEDELVVKKKGASVYSERRHQEYLDDGTVKEGGDSMETTTNLELLTKEMDHTISSTTKRIIQQIQESDTVPKPLKSLFHFYLERGGTELGFKRVLEMQIAESGGQLHDGIHGGAAHEYLMYDASKYEKRVTAVKGAFGVVQQELKEFFGDDHEIEIVPVASWATDQSDELKDGRDRLHCKQVAMESIFQRPVDIKACDTVPYGPTGELHDWSKGRMTANEYDSDDLDGGNCAFDSKIDQLGPYALGLVDTNNFLFNDKRGASLEHLIEKKGYRLAVIVWEYQAVLLFHDKRKNGIWLHAPLSNGLDAWEKMPLENIVEGGMLIQLTSMIVRFCQCGMSRDAVEGMINSSFHDGIFAGYAQEHVASALHFTCRFQQSALGRDILTPKDVFAMDQNDITKVRFLDEEYGSARNLRKKHMANHKSEVTAEADDFLSDSDSEGEEDDDESDDDNDSTAASGNQGQPKKITRKHLAIIRSVNLLSQLDSYGSKSIKAVMDKINIVFQEHPTTSTGTAAKNSLSARWKCILKRVTPKSKLDKALRKELKKSKANKGNTKSQGKSKAESAAYQQAMKLIRSLDGSPFWVHLPYQQGREMPDADLIQHQHPVIKEATFSGVETHLSNSPLSIRRIRMKTGRRPAITSSNGAFVLCHLIEK